VLYRCYRDVSGVVSNLYSGGRDMHIYDVYFYIVFAWL